jgi:uncharacterized protein (TIGR00725 family)
MPLRPPIVAVCGGGEADRETAALAEAVGRELAAAGAIIVCGGLAGVMGAACRGAKEQGGTTVGIVPGTRTDAANEYVDIPIASGMADGRNAIITHTADGVIALPGRFGTLSEVALALKMGKPVVSVGSWTPDPKVQEAPDAKTAVMIIMKAIGR